MIEQKARALLAADDLERATDQHCFRCDRTGQVLVAPIRWNQQRHLIWRCDACGHAWTTLERRRTS